MRSIVALVVLSWSASVGAAQTVAECLATAQQKFEAKQWQAALELLLPLQERVTTDAEREELANGLFALGVELREAAALAEALRAHEAGLVQRRRLHGEADHPDVAKDHQTVTYPGNDKAADCPPRGRKRPCK